MPDLPSVTNLINSPPGQLVAGAALAGIVWKFFERVEAVLYDDTKLEVALWLWDIKTTEKAQKWSLALTTIFQRIFGAKQFSWKCISRSTIASTAALIGASLLSLPPLRAHPENFNWHWIVALWAGCVTSDFISLLLTRSFFSLMERYPTRAVSFIIADFLLSVIFAWLFFDLWGSAYYTLREFWIGTIILPWEIDKAMILHFLRTLLLKVRDIPSFALVVSDEVGPTVDMHSAFVLSSLITSIPLWLFAGSGFLLKAARRFDIGFQWFNRKADIEKHPLNAIGLVAGSLVALIYWAWAVFRHFYPS